MDKRLFQKRAKEALKAYTREEIQDINFEEPSVEDIEQIADMGDVSIDWLLGRESHNVIDEVLNDKEIKSEMDLLSGKEIELFGKWSENYIRDGKYTPTTISELYATYKKGKKIQKAESSLLRLIYEKILIRVLCGK